MHKQPLSLDKLRQVPRQCSWVDQRLVREGYISALAPGLHALSVPAHRGRCPRLELLHRALLVPALTDVTGRVAPARQLLTQQGLLAYRRPLYQVLALEAPERRPLTDPTREEDTVDIKAVFAQIWEVLA